MQAETLLRIELIDVLDVRVYWAPVPYPKAARETEVELPSPSLILQRPPAANLELLMASGWVTYWNNLGNVPQR